MTWDDGLSLDALGQYLRRHDDAADAMPLLLFCIDCSRFLRHVARAANKAPAEQRGGHFLLAGLLSCM